MTQDPGDRRPRIPAEARTPLVLAAAALLLIAAVAFAVWFGPRGVFNDGPSPGAGVSIHGDVVIVRVEEGEDIAALGSRLESAGVVESGRLFRALIALQGIEGQLLAGDYEFTRGQPAGLIIDRLRRGATAELQVTVPEGRRLEEAGLLLEKGNVVNAAEFQIAAASHNYKYSFINDIPRDRTLEGFLFPDTYQFSRTAGPADVVDLMLATFERKVLTAQVLAQIEASPLTLYGVVTLASIVEREAQVADEQPIIASVFLNRLERDIRLDADPTVQYAVSLEPGSVTQWGYWKADLTEEDLRLKSPYNTYQTGGLPPGPIANPGLEAILAVLRPAKTNFLYFVARPDGSHAFAATLEEHKQNVARYQRP